MNQGRTIFSQIMDVLPAYEFEKCINRHSGNKGVRSFTCGDHFRCMSFAQLTKRTSLRDTVICLQAMQSKLYHSGFRCPISKSTIADANESRSWQIYADLAVVLESIASQSYRCKTLDIRLKAPIYALDSSLISLCLKVFPWALYKSTKSAIKIHTLIDVRSYIPSFILISNGKMHDVNILDYFISEPGSFYVMDRAYNDFARLHVLEENRAYFVIREKKNMQYSVTESRKVDTKLGLRCDQTISLSGRITSISYPEGLRRISFFDPEENKRLSFLTNNFKLAAITITQLYKYRWRVEIFFKWIKQHLKIKVFFGTSENAVKCQVWIAICSYLLLSIIKGQYALSKSMNEIQQIIEIAIFEKIPIFKLLN